MNNLGPKENPFNVILIDTCAYIGNGILSGDTLCDSVCWPKWVNEKIEKKRKKKEKKLLQRALRYSIEFKIEKKEKGNQVSNF